VATGRPGELGAAVEAWLAMLDPDQRARATFPFVSEERVAWQYTPGPRAGLPLADLTADQRVAARRIVAAAMSGHGAAAVDAVIALEPILAGIERAADDPMWRARDPERYWFAVFGEPAVGKGAPWGWRIGGHHVLVQSTVVGDRVAFTPSFLGANPAVVPGGPQAGSRALAGEEALARALLASLPAEQRAIAVVDPVAPPDIRSGHGRRAILDGIPVGIRRGALATSQQAALDALVRHYLGRARDEVAEAAWVRIVEAGLDDLAFAWAGPDTPGRGHYYAVRGPRTLIEYDNTQDDANHIHSVWRDLRDDFGDDLLATHYRDHHAPRD
jgi:hypothetical protein